MKKVAIALSTMLFMPLLLLAQGSPEIGIFAGMSTYNGDLQAQRISIQHSHPAVGFIFRKPIYKGLDIRAGFNLGSLSGDDRDAPDSSTILRNLNFRSAVSDFHLMAEYNFFDITEAGFTPYVFAGIAFFHFNPYSKDTSGQKYYLEPLSTEGQGLSAYPDRKPYKLSQFAIPFGAGLKFALNETINLGVEISFRKTFTDYIDDVSTTYVDQGVLMMERGSKAVEFAYRRNQLPGHEKDTYPEEGAMRGSPKYNDWYYFTGVTLTFNLGGRPNGMFGKALRAIRCPF